MEIKFNPIGMIYTKFNERINVPIQPKFSKANGRIEVFSEFTEGLKDLKEFSHIILVYFFDKSRGYKLNVKPFLDENERGVFATRAPNRPNGIGVSVVKLDKIRDNMLYVSNVDIINKTPLLDIKPYIRDFDSVETNRHGWIEGKIKRKHKSDDRFD